MNLLGLMGMMGQAEKIKVSADPSAFAAVVEGLGVKVPDMGLVEAVAKAIRATASDPEQSVAEWFRGGGLARLLAGRKFEESEAEDNVLQCPHCTGLLILTAS